MLFIKFILFNLMEDIQMKDETNSLKENLNQEQNKKSEEISNQDLKREFK